LAKVIGVGGVFFKAKDTTSLQSWYRDTLEIDYGEWGATFQNSAQNPEGYTAFYLFKQDSDYFGSSEQQYMINFVVDDLFACLLKVEKAGGTLVGKPEEHEYGKFGWFLDPEGNKVELWQPK
jgi:predicted enzyme related to lactoylglutathione lyase